MTMFDYRTNLSNEVLKKFKSTLKIKYLKQQFQEI